MGNFLAYCTGALALALIGCELYDIHQEREKLQPYIKNTLPPTTKQK
jgi:hypothetical protein